MKKIICCFLSAIVESFAMVGCGNAVDRDRSGSTVNEGNSSASPYKVVFWYNYKDDEAKCIGEAMSFQPNLRIHQKRSISYWQQRPDRLHIDMKNSYEAKGGDL